MLDLSSTIPLNDGRAIPRLGLGVFQSEPGAETYDAVRAALDLGYRHVDTARLYANERDVGRAVKDAGVEGVFVTTKLWNSDQGRASAKRACERSLQDLGLEAIDLYLLHWPVPGKRLASWDALVELRAEGKVRSIGVSNFTVRHLEELRAASDVVPAVNQVEMSPFLPQEELRAYCARAGIVVEAYAPLTRGVRFRHPVVRRVAAKHGVSPAQVLVRWALQQDVVALPKSVRKERIAENADVFRFALDEEDRTALGALDEALHTSWDPTDAP